MLQDRLGGNVVGDLLVELHDQLGVPFTLFTQQVELLLLVAGDIPHQLNLAEYASIYSMKLFIILH